MFFKALWLGFLSPFSIEDIRPIQMPNLDKNEIIEARAKFSKDEWIDLILRSSGMEPTQFDNRVKWHLLTRLVPLVENNEYQSEGADYFVQKHINNLLEKDSLIDTFILGCTHYPLLIDKIKRFTPPHIQIVAQGEYVAHSLQDYLQRHPEMDNRCTKGGTCHFLTTESSDKFQESASIFLQDETISVKSITLE